MSPALISYTLKAALRDRLVRVILVFYALIASVSLFAGSTAVLENAQFAIIFAASGIRFAAVLGAVLFVAFYIQRSYATKDIDFILSRPLSRTSFVVSQAIAFFIISLLIGGAAFVAMFILMAFNVSTGLVFWSVGLIIEVTLITNIAMFFSMSLSSSVASVAASFGFYMLARMTGTLLGIVKAGDYEGIFVFFGWITKAVTVILPRFDLLVQSSWLIYGPHGTSTVSTPVSPFYMLGLGVFFTLFIVLATIIDLKRKEF